jgi:hypothetical protein
MLKIDMLNLKPLNELLLKRELFLFYKMNELSIII